MTGHEKGRRSGGVVNLGVALTRGLALWQQLALVACFLILFGWAVAATVVAWRSPSVLAEGKSPAPQENKIAGLLSAMAMLNVDCEQLLRAYRRLQQDFPNEARLPLNPNSWPNAGQTWTYAQCKLFVQFAIFDSFTHKARSFWQQMQWKNMPAVLKMSKDAQQSVVLLQLIADIEAFQRTLLDAARQVHTTKAKTRP